MANERAQNVIVVQAPVHYPLVIVSLGGCQNALIVVSELDEVHPISLRVVRVDLLSALKVVKADAEVLAAGNQVLSIVADIHRVNLLLLPPSKENTRKSEFGAKSTAEASSGYLQNF